MKKLLAALLLCILFILPINVQAIENAETEYFEKVAYLLKTHGNYELWALEPKLEWISALHKFSRDEEIIKATQAILEESKPDAEKELTATNLLLELYSENSMRVETLNLYYCMIKEFGLFDLWSLEERALFSDLNIKFFPEIWDTSIDSIPNESAISPEMAIEIAKAEISSVEGLPKSFDWDSFEVSIRYGVRRKSIPDRNPWYSIYFMLPIEDNDPARLPYTYVYQCSVSREGQVMDTTYYDYTYSPEEIKAQREDILPSVGPFFSAPNLIDFSSWSINEKAEFSEEWQPLAHEYLRDHPDYRGPYYLATQYKYGMPSTTSISQEQGYKFAKEAIISLLAIPEDEINRCQANYYYDISDPKRPLWKIYFSTTYSYNYQYGDGWGYFVILDAVSGEIIQVYERTLELDAALFY